MRPFIIPALIILFITPLIQAQEKAQTPVTVQFTGFIKNDFYWDTRQVLALRQNQFLLYPLNEKLDKNGVDVNEHTSFHFVAIQTRLAAKITGPDALGAKTSGYIEGEFFGMSETDINGFRLRHAFIKLDWAKSMLMLGQYWHPMFNVNCFPETVSFNTGAPFVPFTRNPQIRFQYSLGAVSLQATAYSQIDFADNGPIGVNSIYLRNSAIPGLNALIEYSKKDTEKQREVLFAISGNYKTLLPQLQTDSGYQTKEKISALTFNACFKYKTRNITVKAGATLGESLHDFTMLGGYGKMDSIDVKKGIVSYTPLGVWSAWTDIMTNGKTLSGGLYAAYSGNMGYADPVTISGFYGRGNDIKYLYRIAPRLIYQVGKFRIAPEIEYTVAAYGKPDLADQGKVTNEKEVGNTRFLIGVFYFF